MRFSTAYKWLDWMATLHVREMDLGLERIRMVAERLAVLKPICPVITVGGTNGKGSTVAGLESIYRAAGYKVGAFTSPMLFKPNEQIRINGYDVSDEELCNAFEKVADALSDVTLTQFEFFTLAAFVLFKKYSLDVWILEVGLGGRLDAVNIIDADVAVITSIAIDHVEWLGDTREKIGFEKAGIFRAGKPAVCGDPNPPQTLIDYANEIGAQLHTLTPTPLPQSRVDFSIQRQSGGRGNLRSTAVLNSTQALLLNPSPARKKLDKNSERDCGRGVGVRANVLTQPTINKNIETILTTINVMQPLLPASQDAITSGIETASIPGRQQIIPGNITQIWDVSHNPASIKLLSDKLNEIKCQGKTRAVFSMLADKDIQTSINMIKDNIDQWYVSPLDVKRGASREMLEKSFKIEEINSVLYFSDIHQAYQEAIDDSKNSDRVVMFGSFHTLNIVISRIKHGS